MDTAVAVTSMIDTYLNAYQRHDAAGCAALYTNDAVVISSFGPPVTGRAAIAAAHKEWFAHGEENKVMTLLDFGSNGALGWCLIHYMAEVARADGPRTIETGHSLNILARQADGAYLIRKTCLVHSPEAIG